MELISCLENSRHSDGLSRLDLTNLEAVYKNAVGDKQEIDIKAFKKIFQSKNMFFAERVFKMFDTNNSGSVSLNEFMQVMRNFLKQSPESKLLHLFKIYDLNDDGAIQLPELKNVINECLEENGLKFDDRKVDELTRLLFEDADSDCSGNITFREFEAQIRRYPAFMENLSFSIERWLLPPREQKQTKSKGWLQQSHVRKLDPKYMKNNLTNVTFAILYLMINIGLFISAAISYKKENGFVIIARGCGLCLNFNCAFILVLILRKTLTLLRTRGFSKYLPIDQHLYYHKLTGYFIIGFSILHTVMHICNFINLSLTPVSTQHEEVRKENQTIAVGCVNLSLTLVSTQHEEVRKENQTSAVDYGNGTRPLWKLLISTEYGIGWVHGSASLTGWILLLILFVMLVSSMPFVRKREKFEVFYRLHQLAILFWICLILHAQNFWMWLVGPAVLYIIETTISIKHHFSDSMKTCILQSILLPSNVIQLVIKRPEKFDFKPGDYVYINIPAIAKFEWHPFTISSAPEKNGVIWLHVRGVGGWTNSLYSFFDRYDKEAVPRQDQDNGHPVNSAAFPFSFSSQNENLRTLSNPDVSPTKSVSLKELYMRSMSEAPAHFYRHSRKGCYANNPLYNACPSSSNGSPFTPQGTPETPGSIFEAETPEILYAPEYKSYDKDTLLRQDPDNDQPVNSAAFSSQNENLRTLSNPEVSPTEEISLKELCTRSLSEAPANSYPHGRKGGYINNPLSNVCPPSSNGNSSTQQRNAETPGSTFDAETPGILYIPKYKRSISRTISAVSAIYSKDAQDNESIVTLKYKTLDELEHGPILRTPTATRDPEFVKLKRRSVRLCNNERSLKRCETLIILPSITEEDEERHDLENEKEVSSVVVAGNPVELYIDGPYGSPTRHIFHAQHAVLIAAGIGVTPFASILQSIMYQYRKSRHTCPNCQYRWTDAKPVNSLHLKKVDFIWLNRNQRCFEWFVSLLSELEVEQTQINEEDRFLDMHMYITSALDRTDMKAVGLQIAMDLLYQKEKRCLITGLKSRTQPGRPNWTEVFTNILNQRKGKVTVFYCGPPPLGKVLRLECSRFGFEFRKETF